MGLHMRSRLLTTTRSKGRPVLRMRAGNMMTTRLPKNRAPTHPGEMLLEEFLKPMGITRSDFAVKLGVSFPRLNEIIKGRRGVTPDTALRLAKVLGMSAEFWLGLQLDWDLWNAMQSKQYAEIAQLQPLKHGA